jgi:putative Holliday junction resolvase
MPGTPETAPLPTTVLGFDFGTRRIGVAYGQRVTGTARALAVVANGAQPDWAHLDQLVRDWRPDALVVGLPLTLDGAEQDASRRARRFGAALGERYRLPVHEQDERLSSVEASARFAAARRQGTRRQKHAELLDAMAAQVIVESFLARLAARTIAAPC